MLVKTHDWDITPKLKNMFHITIFFAEIKK